MTLSLAWLSGHQVVAPIVLPLMAGAVLMLLEISPGALRRRWVAMLSVGATLLFTALAAGLVWQAAQGDVTAYLLGNWQAPFGIALALDRLSALMLMLTAIVALAALVYALGGAAARGAHFHSLFQFQLMGLAGAFLTADLFNLFVFFEVLLAASYGLLLHGATQERLKAAVHYVIFNLAGSALFLLAVSLLYALAGTLSMADLAYKLGRLPAGDVALAQAAALLLLVVFAVKAALLPLYFWLPDTYAAASAPVAALFAIMTKVGVYAIARTTTLVFGAGALAGVAQPLLPALALATLVLAAIGALAARRLSGLVAYLVVASAGTLLLAIGLGTAATVGAALFYMMHSTLVAAAWFLLVERIGAARDGSDRLQPAAMAAGWAPLGLAFVAAAVAMAGMPPAAGFIGKALLLQAAGATAWAPWVVAIVLGSSLTVMVALARAGSVLFWKLPAAAPAPRPTTPVHWHRIALGMLFAAIAATVVAAGPLSSYAAAAARQLFEPERYVAAVLGARPVPPAWDLRREMRERGEPK